MANTPLQTASSDSGREQPHATAGTVAAAEIACAMSKENPLAVPEREFILEALEQNVRLDGRRADDIRPLDISFGEEYGHVKVQLGKTRFVTNEFLVA